MAALNLAAIKIQKIFRGFIIRKNKNDLKKYLDDRTKRNLEKNKKNSNPAQKFRTKFLNSRKHFKAKSDDEAYKTFCITKIAATFRMSLVRRLFKFYNFSIYHIASFQIQQAWKRHSVKKPIPLSKEEISAHKIQLLFLNLWIGHGDPMQIRVYSNITKTWSTSNSSNLLNKIKRQPFNTSEVN